MAELTDLFSGLALREPRSNEIISKNWLANVVNRYHGCSFTDFYPLFLLLPLSFHPLYRSYLLFSSSFFLFCFLVVFVRSFIGSCSSFNGEETISSERSRGSSGFLANNESEISSVKSIHEPRLDRISTDK